MPSSLCHSSIQAASAPPLPSCKLFDLVVDRNWDAVARHANDHPEDAAFLDGEWKETPLYCACQFNPSEEAVCALLKAYPPAATVGSKNGDFPLHIACRYMARTEVIGALIEHDPMTLFVATKYGKTPLMALWDAHNATSGRAEDTFAATCERSKMLLEAVARIQGLVDRDSGEPLCLHAAMMMKCSDELLYFVLEEYQHQIPMRDRQSRLPLHLAVAPGIPSQRKHWRCVFESLLSAFPEAAKTPDPVTGRLPLHTMVSNSTYTWNEIEVVFHASPQTIKQRDYTTGLVTFALAATTSTKSVEASFCLLRAQPDLIAPSSILSSPKKK